MGVGRLHGSIVEVTSYNDNIKDTGGTLSSCVYYQRKFIKWPGCA